MSGRQQRVMVQPIVSRDSIFFRYHTDRSHAFTKQNVIFKNLQQVTSFIYLLPSSRSFMSS
jgi:hypothetical protein